MKPLQITVVSIILLLACFGSYRSGWKNGQKEANVENLKAAIVIDLHLFRIAGGGEEKLKNDLGLLILAHTDEFQKTHITVNDTNFQEQLSEAIIIAKSVRTNLVIIK
jgi:hypothetical protein